jgi:hypothetical protein
MCKQLFKLIHQNVEEEEEQEGKELTCEWFYQKRKGKVTST